MFDYNIMCFLFSRVARKTLRVRLYGWETVESEVSHFSNHLSDFFRIYYRKGYNQERMTYLLYAICLSYVPNGKEGYAYLEKKTSPTPLWKYRYKNITDKLAKMGEILSERDKNSLTQILQAHSDTVFEINEEGIVAMLLRIRAELESCAWANENGPDTLSMINSLNKVMDEIVKKVEESEYAPIDITEFLPKYESYELSEKRKAEIDELFEAQAENKTVMYNVTREELESIHRGCVNFFVPRGDCTLNVGDAVVFKNNNVIVNASVKERREYTDSSVIENIKCIKEACSSDPTGKTVLLALDSKNRQCESISRALYEVAYDSSEAGELEKGQTVCLLEKADVLSVFFWVGTQVILNDVNTGKSHKATIKEKTLVMDKDSLYKNAPKDTVCIPAVDYVAKRWVTDNYFDKSAYIVTLEVTE